MSDLPDKSDPGGRAVRLRHYRYSPWVLSGLLALTLFDALTPWRWATVASGAALLAASAVYAVDLQGLGRWFSVSFAAGSAALSVAYRIPLSDVLVAATNGGQVLAFLLLVEVLGAAVEAGRYDRVLTGLLARGTPSVGSLRRAVSAGSFVLNLAGMFMGSVPAAFYALGGKPRREDLPLAVAASRGFGASSLINPASPLVVLAMAGSGAHLLPYLASALPVAAFMLLLDWLAGAGPDRSSAEDPSAPAGQRLRSSQAFALAVGLAAALLVYQIARVPGMGVLPRVGLAVVAGALVVGLVEPARLGARLRVLPRTRFVPLADTVPYFALGAAFGTLLVNSRLLTPILSVVSRLHLPALEFPLVVALVAALRWLGLAPVIAVMILGPIFAHAVSLAPPLYALSLVFGGVVGFLGSPLSGTNLFVASVGGLSPFEVSMRVQGWYVATTAGLASLYAGLLSRWLSSP